MKDAIRRVGLAFDRRRSSSKLIDDEDLDMLNVPQHDDMKGFQAGEAARLDALSNVREILERNFGNITDPPCSSKRFKKYYKKAEGGDPVAQFVIGVCYQFGVQPDLDPCYSSSMKWYLEAAENGSAKALNNIAVMIQHGLAGFTKDDGLSVSLFRCAAAEGVYEAEINMTVLLVLSENMAVQDRVKAYEILSAMTERESTTRQAVNNMGCLLLRGFGCTVDHARAVQFFKTAANMGSCVAMYNMGVVYLHGYGVPKDAEQSREWFSQAKKDKNHEDHPCVMAATDQSKLLMFTTMNSCL